MLAEREVSDVVALLGRRKTSPRDLREALCAYGWTMDSRHCAKLPVYPEGAALLFGETVRDYRLLGHWMLWTGDEIWDPAAGATMAELWHSWSGRFYRVREG